MGMMALAGAIGGVGAGMEKNVEHNRELEKMDLEEARETRLRQFENEHADKRQDKGFSHEESMQDKGFTQQKDLQKGGFEHDESMQKSTFGQQDKTQKSTQEFTGSEGAKDRASREKVAGISAAARGAAASRSAAAKRWESKVVKSTTLDEKGLPTENEVISMVDKNTGRAYVQDGTKFFLQGSPKTRTVPGTGKDKRATQAPIKDAARSAVQRLIDNPDQADNFVRMYGYLPYEFFNGMGNNAGVYDATPPAATDDGTDE
jgi:hypothetical protein